jgi:magnesium and cobalt exporter, CNNM family
VTLFLELLAVALLLALNAFFVAAEYALVTARRTRIAELEQQGNRRARAVLAITANPPRFIAAMQLGVTLTSLAIGAVGEPVLARIFDPVLAGVLAFLIAFLLITYLHVVIGELVPKGLALGHAEATALVVSGPVRLFFFVFRPLIWVLQRSSEVALRLLGLEPPGSEGAVYSEAELMMLVNTARERGAIEQVEQELIYKAFSFADKEAHDVMVPRPEVVMISVDLPAQECLAQIVDSPFTRYPAYNGSVDEIVGILHVRDLFKALYDRGIDSVQIQELLRPPFFVPETKDLAALLAEFRKTNQHMAIVVDEYGSMEGIVTLEDLLEEIVGEIEDEYDLPDESIERVDDRTIRIDGTFPIDDFNEQFGLSIPVEDFHTMGGFVFGLLGRAPERGDSVDWDGLKLQVVEVEGSRIDRLTIVFEEPNEEPQAEVVAGG